MHLAVKLLIRPVLRAGPVPGNDERTSHKQDTPKRSVKTRVTFASPSTTAQHIFSRAAHRYSQSRPDFWGLRSALKLAPGVRGLKGRNVLFGFGSDLSEEPAVQDVEPVTLDFVVVPECPPGPTL
jgi:hypothetical protein